jgi:hypothetical protein
MVKTITIKPINNIVLLAKQNAVSKPVLTAILKMV